MTALLLALSLACSAPPGSAGVSLLGGKTGTGGDTGTASTTSGGDGGSGADTGETETGGTDSGGTDSGGGTTASPTAAACFAAQGLNVDYDQFGPVVGSHCKGTNHQDITGVQHVVFVGDSITVGTPPTAAEDWYRNRLAEALVDRFGLEAPDWLWQNVDLLDGMTWEQDSGDFSSCAKWGARTDDLTDKPHQQLVTCIPEDRRDETTLVIMTSGGNDVFSWAQDMVAGSTEDELWAMAEQAVLDLEESVHWLVDDPSMFPGGVYLVFANPFEFTDEDSGNDFATCTGADWIGMDTALVDPGFTPIVSWMMEQYMRIATETGTDMIFMGEHACGHGYMADDPDGRCYRGEDAELWLDITCMHPSAEGHAGIADLFLAVVDE